MTLQKGLLQCFPSEASDTFHWAGARDISPYNSVYCNSLSESETPTSLVVTAEISLMHTITLGYNDSGTFHVYTVLSIGKALGKLVALMISLSIF